LHGKFTTLNLIKPLWRYNSLCNKS